MELPAVKLIPREAGATLTDELLNETMFRNIPHEATLSAHRSAAEGRLLPDYAASVSKEYLFGILNLVLFLLAGIMALWRPAFR